MEEALNVDKIGKAIQFLRKRAGYTQLELAERLLVSDKAVSRWERGKGIPDVSLLRRLSIILDTDIDSLLEGTVAVQENSWKGLLYIDYPVDIIIYDKPLADFLLSYFLLARVRDIIILAPKTQIDFLNSWFGDGEKLNISISYCERNKETLSNQICGLQDFFANSNVMALYGPCVLYGADLTRFLRRGMLNENKVSTLLTVKNDPDLEVFIDDEKVVISARDESVKTKYHYCPLPFLYAHGGVKKLIGNYKSFDELIREMIHERILYAEPMDKGFVDFDVRDIEDVLMASTFISIVQKRTGALVCDPKEIAIRRGFIEESSI